MITKAIIRPMNIQVYGDISLSNSILLIMFIFLMLFTFECFYSVLDGGEDALNGCIGSPSEGEIVQADQ